MAARLGAFEPVWRSGLGEGQVELTAGVQSSQVRPEMGPKRDSLGVAVGAEYVHAFNERLRLSARPTFYELLDRPGRVAEDSGWYGSLALRWDLDPKMETLFRPYLLLSRTFGTKPEDATWVGNATVLSLGVSLDYRFGQAAAD